jgi:hypothetical protein
MDSVLENTEMALFVKELCGQTKEADNQASLLKYYIYYHVDPRTNLPIYVGKGSGTRFKDFFSRGKRHKEWTQELKLLGLSPSFLIGKSFESEDFAYSVEETEIRVLRNLNLNLLNIAKGGRVVMHELYQKPIVCITNNKIYNSTRCAAKDLNFLPKRICDVLKGRKKHYRGHQFRYLDPNLNIIPDKIRQDTELNKKISTSKPIQCIETGKKYISATQAARELGVSNSLIYRHFKGLIKKVKGLTFRKL